MKTLKRAAKWCVVVAVSVVVMAFGNVMTADTTGSMMADLTEWASE